MNKYGVRLKGYDSLGNAYNISSDEVHMSFCINHCINGRPGMMELTISEPDSYMEGLLFNIETLELFLTQDKLAQNNEELIFYGDSITAQIIAPSQTNKNNRSLLLSCLDGDAFYQAFSSFSVSAGTRYYDFVKACLSMAGTSMQLGQYPNDLLAKKLIRGASIHGRPRDALCTIVKALDCACFMQNNVFHIIPKELCNQVNSIVLSQNDVIGTPEIAYYGAVVKIPIKPVLLGESVAIHDGAYLSEYRLFASEHTGNTKQGCWQTSLKLMDLNKILSKNAMLWQ